MDKPTVAIVGPGKVGSALASLLDSCGYPLTGIVSRDEKKASCLAKQLFKADVVFLTVPDRFIEEVATQIGNEGGFRAGQFIFHTCGSLTADILKSANSFGAFVGSIHPLQAFADVETAKATLPGSYFALEGDPEAMIVAQTIVEDLEGHSFFVPREHRALYHAAACMASNYMVALAHCAANLYGKFGLMPNEALKALYPLLCGTLANLQQSGATKALTGPISRGDTGTIARHVAALDSTVGSAGEIYRSLGLYTVDIALEKGTIGKQQAMELSEILIKQNREV